MTAATIPPIEGKTTVNVPVMQAFTVFTESFTAWWPHQYHIGQSDVAEVILESREVGHWYERGVDGSECDWGRVLAWEPPSRVLFTWQIGGNWQFDPDPTHAPAWRQASGGCSRRPGRDGPVAGHTRRFVVLPQVEGGLLQSGSG